MNKFKYFTVTQTSIVKANNKTEALRAARSSRRVPQTEVLWSDSEVDRIPAVEAHSFTEGSNISISV